MKYFVAAAALLGVVFCNVEDHLFPHYSGVDDCMDETEWERLWFHFDLNDDGNVTKLEFDTVWKREDFHNDHQAPFFFEEMDRVADEILNSQDFVHTYRLFDEDRNGCITSAEFKYNWRGYFDIDG
eukprot:GHVL01010361.1.p2 GENE.GHVL01010361.1~~GHVL01010361.1.p2  ORF type:complete len:126 (+),score=11.32 GHVL01010361.1:60-437(+)